MGGYQYREAHVSNIGLPDKMKCGRCNKMKDTARNFSNKQQNDAKDKVRAGKAATANCMLCTGQQPKELECQRCDKWLALDDFSKAQRKNPDNAICEKCMKIQVETEPVEVSGTRGIYHSDDEDDDDEYGDDEYVTSYGPTTTATQSNRGQNVDLLGMSARSDATTTHPATTTVNNSGSVRSFDPTTYSAVASRSSSTAGSVRANASGSRSRFARVPAYKRPPRQDQPEEEEEREEEEDDDDPWAGNAQDSDDDESPDEDKKL
ncbi:Stc1 domain-containing protein [Phyllosticta citricarpa]